MNAMEFSGALADVVETAARSVVRLGGRSAVSGTVFSGEGHVVAVNHTLDRDDVEVGLPDGRTVAGHVVGRDGATDLALVKADASGMTVAPWSDADASRVGELLVAVYRPGRPPEPLSGPWLPSATTGAPASAAGSTATSRPACRCARGSPAGSS